MPITKYVIGRYAPLSLLNDREMNIVSRKCFLFGEYGHAGWKRL